MIYLIFPRFEIYFPIISLSGTSSLRSSTKSPFQRNVQRSRAEQQIQNDLDTLKPGFI